MNSRGYWVCSLATKLKKALLQKAPNTECVETTRAIRIRVAEHASVAVFLNPTRTLIRKIRIDECVIRAGIRCDWVLSKADCVDVLVELKGADVNHAVDQLLKTIEVWRDHPLRGKNTKLAALVVCSQYPRVDTRIQRAKMTFASRFRTPLHISSRGGEFVFCSLATFVK